MHASEKTCLTAGAAGLIYKAAFKMVYATGYISRFDYFSVISVQFIVALVPRKLRGWIFKKMLHGKKKS